MNSWNRRPALGAALAGALALGTLAGCSSSSNSGSSSVSGNSGDVTLVVYSSQGYDSAVTKAFSKATGIPVSLDDDSTGPLLAKVGAERNNPQWGLLWVDGDTAFAELDQQGQLLDYNPGVTLTTAGQKLVPADHAYSPVSTTAVPALIYNAAKVSAVPSSWQDLLGAQYKNKVGMNDPSQSGPTFPLIAGLMNELGGQSGGVAAGEAYLSKLKANGLQIHPTNGDTLHALETGQIDYGLIQSSAAAGEVATAKKGANYDPKVVYLGTTTLLPGVIGIDKGASAKVQQEAEKFVQYVLSPAGQKIMQTGDPTGDSLYWPIVPGLDPVTAIGAMPATYQRIDPAYWGPLETQVNTWFDQNIK
jgi:iron(III) transport system substrate-binding protein